MRSFSRLIAISAIVSAVGYACAPVFEAGVTPPPPVEPVGEVYPEASYPGDTVLRSHVETALRDTPGLEDSAIRVDVEEGDVFLSGSVPTNEQRVLAHDVVYSVPDVRRVFYDDLIARTGTYEPPLAGDVPLEDDSILRGRIYEALARAPGIDASAIQVDLRNTDVWLSGSVRSESERELAHDVVQSVAGVDDVFIRDLRVERDLAGDVPPGYAPVGEDAILAERIAEALRRAPAIDASEIRVMVDDREVRLTGTVRSEAERQIAHEVAHSVAGVSDVSVRDLRVR